MHTESLFQRIRRVLESKGKLVLGSVVGLTIVVVSLASMGINWRGAANTPTIIGPNNPIEEIPVQGKLSNEVKISTQISHKKVTLDQKDEIYLEVKIQTPKGEVSKHNKPLDFVVVLDQSSSMDSPQKFPLAKKALIELVNKLKENDRLAIVSFSSSAQVFMGLTEMKGSEKERVISRIKTWSPGGSTNFESALNVAQSVLKSNQKDRASRVLFLSDGEITAGSRDPKYLARLVKSIVSKDAVLSTIGMGLQFDEKSLSNLADHGMGQYHFLEGLSQLAKIFEEDILMANQLYAGRSELRLRLGEGVEVIDAGGYPVEKGGTEVVVPTGQLLSGKETSFFISLKVNPKAVGSMDLAKVGFSYVKDGQNFQAKVSKPSYNVTVVEPSRIQEVYKSMDKEVYKKSWLGNNIGRIQKKVAHLIKKGRSQEARSEIQKFKQEITSAAKNADFNYAGSGAAQEMDDLMDASEADPSGVARDRAAKKIYSKSIKAQRVSK